MSKKSGLICLGLGLAAGYAICKYGESISNTVKAKLEKKSVDDLADEIKDTISTGKDDFAEYLRNLRKKNSDCDCDGDEEVIEVTKAGEEVSTIVESENKIESVEDLVNKFNEIIHEMNKDTYKVLDALKQEKEEVEEVKEDKEVSKPKTTRKRKPAQKKEIKIEDAE